MLDFSTLTADLIRIIFIIQGSWGSVHDKEQDNILRFEGWQWKSDLTANSEAAKSDVLIFLRKSEASWQLEEQWMFEKEKYSTSFQEKNESELFHL